MQRVIQTTLYFEPSDISGLARSRDIGENPGVTFLCFPGAVTSEFELREESNLSLAGSGELVVWRTIDEIYDQRLKGSFGRLFLNAAVRGAVYRTTRAERFEQRASLIDNSRIVSDLFQTDVVIEESPPRWEKFGVLLQKAPDVVIGTYVGMEAARGHPTLMIFSVAGSIIVVGSAIAISRALQRGLNKRIRQIFKSRRHERGRR
jgi:hypothetical protein